MSIWDERCILAPSLISCCDLCNLEQSVKTLEDGGIELLHVDILDGHFSPSMPLGLDTVAQLRTRTSMPFDVHLMASENDYFVRELLDIGVEQLVFHAETERHIDNRLNQIHAAGARAGIALKPATPLSVLDYVLEKCDAVLLMLINPGYAQCRTEGQVPYAARKIRELREKVRPALEAEMAALEANTEKMIRESRSLIFELSPPILKEVGINPALESLADNLLTPHGIKWELRAKGTMADFWADDAVCVILYRMARELLINVIKHSGATRGTIIVTRGPGKIMVAVEDNGRGFPEDFDLDHNEARKETKSFGLFSIRERLEPIDGTLKIVSIPGKGATVAMSCPLKLKEGEFK